MKTDHAREHYSKIVARFNGPAPISGFPESIASTVDGNEAEFVVNGKALEIMDRLRKHDPVELTRESLTLEEIFIATLK